MKFYVTLQLIEYHEETVEINAPNPRKAVSKAKALADELEFQDLTDSEVNVVSIERTGERNKQ